MPPLLDAAEILDLPSLSAAALRIAAAVRGMLTCRRAKAAKLAEVAKIAHIAQMAEPATLANAKLLQRLTEQAYAKDVMRIRLYSAMVTLDGQSVLVVGSANELTKDGAVRSHKDFWEPLIGIVKELRAGTGADTQLDESSVRDRLRELIRRLHPDKGGDGKEAYRFVKWAMEAFRDSKVLAAFDLHGPAGAYAARFKQREAELSKSKADAEPLRCAPGAASTWLITVTAEGQVAACRPHELIKQLPSKNRLHLAAKRSAAAVQDAPQDWPELAECEDALSKPDEVQYRHRP